jgi:hypothetical protein
MPFTPDSDLDLLFPEELVPHHIKSELPPELHVRLPIHIHLSAIAPSLRFSPSSPSFPIPMSFVPIYLSPHVCLTYSGMLLYFH